MAVRSVLLLIGAIGLSDMTPNESARSNPAPTTPPPLPLDRLLGVSPQELLDSVLRHFPNGSVNVLDRDFRFQFATGKGLATVGLSSELLVGKALDELFSADVVAHVRPHYLRALAGEDVEFELPFGNRNFAISAGPLCNRHGEVVAIIVVAVDSTDRHRDELAQRLLLDASVLLAGSLDYETTLGRVARLMVPEYADFCFVCVIENSRLRWLVPANGDSTRAELLCARLRPLDRAVPSIVRVLSTERPDLIEDIASSATGRRSLDAKLVTALRDAGVRSVLIAPMVGRGGPLGAFWFVSVDHDDAEPGHRFDPRHAVFAQELAKIAAMAMENVLLHRQLEERQQTLRHLVARLMAVQEDERRRVAYEVHDQIAQVAASAYQHLQAFADRHKPRSPDAQRELNRALELAQAPIREARQLVAGLRPTELDDFGLGTALRRLLERLQTEGWTVGYEDRLGAIRLPRPIEIALFRVTQEALTNVRKHARTTRVSVSLTRIDDRVVLRVRDWGIGFSPSCADEVEPGTRVGLAGMQERVALLGGRCNVVSRPGRGTTVVAELPAYDEEKEAAP